MSRPRFYFLEPSKVGSQHLTLIEGYLMALASSEAVRKSYQLVFCAASSTLAILPAELKSEFDCQRVAVVNPESRRLVLKTFVELYVIMRYLVRLRREDFLFVSCVLPTTLWLLEKCVSLFGGKRIHLVLHGEIEGIFEKSLQSMRSFGYWADRWLRSRRPSSTIDLVVLDDFIKAKLVDSFPKKLGDDNVSVVPHPIIWDSLEPKIENVDVPTVCFVGYRSRYKGFEEFLRLASDHPEIRFVAIGEGKIEDLRSGEISAVNDNETYLHELSKCAAAVFPYTALYTCSLSAAALDTLSVGVQIVAYERPFFISIADHFGPESVTVCRSYAELRSAMDTGKLRKNYKLQSARLERLSRSRYCLSAVQASFERLVNPQQEQALEANGVEKQ